MNILLWVFQVLLGLYYLMGGSWMVSKVPGAWLKILPKAVWITFGLLQALFALGLVLPAALKIWPIATPIAAVCVAVETIGVGILNRVKFQGFLWILIPAVLSLFVAYGRFVLSPF